MTLRQLPDHAGEWLRGSGPHNEVVISSRLRLARNLAGYPFVNRATPRQLKEIVDRCRDAITTQDFGDQVLWVDLLGCPELDRQLLVERHLISRQHGVGDKTPRAVGIASQETFSVMVNEEDQLRIQVLRSGMQLTQAFEQAMHIDDALESKLEYAFSQQLGYLTACPTNLGTGIRVSVMMHLAVRGLFGEGSEALGDLFQISNQTTLGRSEQEVLADFERSIVPQIISYEQQARQALVRHRPDQLDDKIWRAWGVLTNARMISTEETLSLLSHLRLGVNLGRIDKTDIPTINEMFLLTQPAHLQKLTGQELDQTQRREARAKLIRRRLGVR